MIKIKRAYLGFLLLIFSALAAYPVHISACSIDPAYFSRAVDDFYAGADFAIIGRVMSVNYSDSSESTKIKFEVLRQYKGGQLKEIEVRHYYGLPCHDSSLVERVDVGSIYFLNITESYLVSPITLQPAFYQFGSGSKEFLSVEQAEQYFYSTYGCNRLLLCLDKLWRRNSSGSGCQCDFLKGGDRGGLSDPDSRLSLHTTRAEREIFIPDRFTSLSVKADYRVKRGDGFYWKEAHKKISYQLISGPPGMWIEHRNDYAELIWRPRVEDVGRRYDVTVKVVAGKLVESMTFPIGVSHAQVLDTEVFARSIRFADSSSGLKGVSIEITSAGDEPEDFQFYLITSEGTPHEREGVFLVTYDHDELFKKGGGVVLRVPADYLSKGQIWLGQNIDSLVPSLGRIVELAGKRFFEFKLTKIEGYLRFNAE